MATRDERRGEHEAGAAGGRRGEHPGEQLDPHWDALCETLRRAGGRVLAEGASTAPQERAEGFRYLLRFLTAGIRTCVENADPDHPELCRMMDRGRTWGLDCPDCLYLYAPVRGDATYRLFGTRGSANVFDAQVNYGHFASGDIASWGTYDSRSDLDLAVGPDGRFELLIAPEGSTPPSADAGSADTDAGHIGSRNVLRMGPDAEFVLVRQYFADWEGERPADLWIERVGGPVSAPAPRPEQMAARLERLCEWLEKGGTLWENMSRSFLAQPPNAFQVFKPPDEDARGGLAGQAYGMGGYRCGPEEAVVVEFAPPTCRHWSVSLATCWWETVDFGSRQSSLNHHQARLDADGRFRGVIAHADPGVPNWLDAAGHERGTLAIRFLRAEAAPEIRLRTLPRTRVRDALPADTPRVEPAEREAALRRRHRSVMARYRR